MRDRRFIAEHRGGPLGRDRHILLIRWAADCAERVLPLLPEDLREMVSAGMRTGMARIRSTQ